MKLFKDRESAGKLLANRLKKTKADLVLAIPRGGVVVGKEVARILKLPLDVVITRKIGAPMQPELALGAIDPDGEAIWNNQLVAELAIKTEDLKETIRGELDELERRQQVYRKSKGPLDVEGKTVILVDDGVATGATTLAAINYLKRHQAKVILAVPVASTDALDKIKPKVDQLIVLDTPEFFQAVGQFYQDFPQVSDEEVVQLLS